MIHVENLKFSYTGEKNILNGISFHIKKGSVTGLIGDSGCGKSTLCHILSGIIPNEIDGEISGEVKIAGQPLKYMELNEAAEYVGLVMQDPDRQIVTSTVEDELAFGLENRCILPSEIVERVEYMLDFLEIRNLRYENPGRLSGGQKQLVSIGGILTLKPPVLILDEPFSHLDENGRMLVGQLIHKMKEAGQTVLIVEHNYEYIQFADQFIWLEDGTIQAEGTPEEVLNLYESCSKGS